MPPTVILIRHGEALHNASQNYEIHDPCLSELGVQQCKKLETQLREHCKVANDVDVIITSPMIRTIETTLLGLDWLIRCGVPLETDALWQENSAKPCDTGSPTSKLASLFPSVDLSKVDPVYPSKAADTLYAFSKTAVVARGETCLRNLYSRMEKVIAVVSHAGFLRTAVSHVRYANADFRIFDFADSPVTASSPPELVEWPLTADGGGGMGTSEKGRAEIEGKDFPAAKAADEVKNQMGEQSDGDAASEVP